MGQTYNKDKPESGVTTFGELYQILRNHFDACATLFVGSSSPSNPEEGRPWYDSSNKVLKIYDGTQWRTVDYNTTTYTEIVNSRGSHSSLANRLDVSLNPDGTLAGSTPAGAWWTSATSPWAYHSPVQFKETGDKTAVYTVGRALKFSGVSGAPQYSYVTSAVYSGGTTIVTIKDAVLDSSMTTPQFGQIVNNVHNSLPWTRLLYSNSATSKDYASQYQALLADGSGGVSVYTVERSVDLLKNRKKFGII